MNATTNPIASRIMTHSPIQAVPTNIITGFLGVGKTSTILHLLQQKPANERWAVLVNEFGEIGIDGSLYQSAQSQEQGTFIREVPGGCMCCAAGLPMQVALNTLLSQSRPHRLLIEPTGLGHPKEVLSVLTAPHYQDVLQLQNTITLVDARKLNDARYREHDTFNQQIEIADVVVGNKHDGYGSDDETQLQAYINECQGRTVPLVFTIHGAIDLSVLEGTPVYSRSTHDDSSHTHHHHHTHTTNTSKNTLGSGEPPLPEAGYLKVNNQGEGYCSVGWRFANTMVFNHDALHCWLKTLQVERAKGWVQTEQGRYRFNLVQEEGKEPVLQEAKGEGESRLELIANEIQPEWESTLLACLHT